MGVSPVCINRIVTVKGEKNLKNILYSGQRFNSKVEAGNVDGSFFLESNMDSHKRWGFAENTMKQRRKLGLARSKSEFHCLKGGILWET